MILDVDIQTMNVTYNNASISIVRSSAKTYAFSITITSSYEAASIPSVGDGNWQINYLLDNQSHENDDSFLSLFENDLLSYANIPVNVTSWGLTAGSIIQLPSTVYLSFNYSACQAHLYLCLLITPSALAAWNDPNLSNNFACLLLDPYKDCSPGKLYELK